MGDVYAISQGSGASSINASLVRNLTAHAWAELVGPEILAFGTLRGEPVLVRGAEPYTFVRMEAGTWRQAVRVTDRWAFAGEGLARRLDLQLGDDVTVVGSTTPRIEIVKITGIFAAPGPANDELLVDHALARSLTGVVPDEYHSIRVQTADPGAFLGFLETFGASVHVSGPGLPRADIRSEPPGDDRLANLLIRSGRGALPRDYLTSAVSEATNSVRVVAWGLAALAGALVVLCIHAVQSRAFADRRAGVGVLRAVGASGTWLRARLALETLPMAFAAGALGAALGILVDIAVRPAASLVLFGHEIQARADLPTFGAILLLIVMTSLGSNLLLLGRALRERPAEAVGERATTGPPSSLEVVLRG